MNREEAMKTMRTDLLQDYPCTEATHNIPLIIETIIDTHGNIHIGTLSIVTVMFHIETCRLQAAMSPGYSHMLCEKINATIAAQHTLAGSSIKLQACEQLDFQDKEILRKTRKEYNRTLKEAEAIALDLIQFIQAATDF